ncbi:MAG: hypothetical protein HKN82_18260 [Akkermansiaceae bacterium]|nr:hypothetical protein [Akkermansiaceae bacterium]NNM29028.1 hypothetical protein [Akkermansiaceae bacterium]
MNWHRWFHAFIRRLYFSRIRVIGAEHVPAAGPVLALGLHRNGAVDGFVYREAVPEVVFLVEAALRRSLFGRLFFDGVEVERGGGSRAKMRALDACVARLGEGGWLAVFPEGTSRLGPRHLPFKSGAARTAVRHLESGRPLTVLPLGIHYECPWAFRSRVEVIVGPPVDLAVAAAATGRGARLREVKDRFTAALEAVGVNVPDAAWQDLAQNFAYIATLGTGHSYFAALKVMEDELPAEAVAAWRELESKAAGRMLMRHQGVPLFPLATPWVYLLGALALALPVAAGALVNLPPLAAGWWAGRRFPDDTNVISLWRILTGVPMFLCWAVTFCVWAAMRGPWWLAPAYLFLTWTSIRGWYRLKKSAVTAWNGIFCRGLRAPAHAVHRAVIAAMSRQDRTNKNKTNEMDASLR